jgi:glycine betaine/choline ABC-type transport system substrate-binding protein
MAPPAGYTGQINLQPAYKGSAANSTQAAPSTNKGSYNDVAAKLGEDWSWRQQYAAENGDWATYYKIQKQVEDILNPPVAGPVVPK